MHTLALPNSLQELVALQAMTDCLVQSQLDWQIFMVQVVMVAASREALVLHVVQDLLGILQLIVGRLGLMRHIHLLMVGKVQI